jgi:ATP-dependent Lon protease
VALKVAQGQGESFTINPEDLEEYLGTEMFFYEEARKQLPPGVATGLAVTEMGGEVLFIEAALLPGAKGLTLTGQLGNVMQESAKAAQSYLWSHSDEVGVDCREIFDKNGIHIHVPAGATPKDGPSAGVAIISAIGSLCAKRPVRSDTAMTGEITLSGLVMPIGGVKGKLLAARRAGIKRVILPKRNENDLKEVPEEALRDLDVIFVERVDELLKQALAPPADGAQREEQKDEGREAEPAEERKYEGEEVRV